MALGEQHQRSQRLQRREIRNCNGEGEKSTISARVNLFTKFYYTTDIF